MRLVQEAKGLEGQLADNRDDGGPTDDLIARLRLIIQDNAR